MRGENEEGDEGMMGVFFLTAEVQNRNRFFYLLSSGPNLIILVR